MTDSQRQHRNITDQQLRELYLSFFAERGHTVIPSSSLVPENDPTVLFTTAGMHPLTPYLLGEPHPGGKRLVDYQKCVRTTDIDEVGDRTHLTLFEMLGNWSLGDYYKQESITWSYEFLTAERYLGLSPDQLWVTIFEGNDVTPRDDESIEIWMGLGIPRERIIPLGAEHNWWAAGPVGPCGPDTEIFVDRTGEHCERGDDCLPGVCDCGRFFEIWNNVFMVFEQQPDEIRPLRQRNVDTGMGLERTVAMLNGYSTVYEAPSLAALGRAITGDDDWMHHPDKARAYSILVDHLRAASFIIGDQNGVDPGNQGRGYVVRRLIRRSVRLAQLNGIDPHHWAACSNEVVRAYGEAYPELSQSAGRIRHELELEVKRFLTTLDRGTRKLTAEIERARNAGETTVSGEVAFHLYDTDGFPVEFTKELAGEAGLDVDLEDFERRFEEHRRISRGARTAGGLADDSEESVRYHTATHLLHEALREVLGDHVLQKGSNITRERLRFDFNHSAALTPEQIQAVTDLVQEQIDRGLAVTRDVMPVQQARDLGAIGLFDEKYGGDVSVYRIGDFSLEFCGGPHVQNTNELGRFRIMKEQSAGAGVRRIRAVLE